MRRTASEYFSKKELNEDLAHRLNDEVSMYNLAHLYLYEEPIKESINQSIDLLIRSLKEGFFSSFYLLGIALIKKYGNDIESITQKLDEQTNDFDRYKILILETIGIYISCQSLYESRYQEYKNIDFLYNVLHEYIRSDEMTKEKEIYQQKSKKFQLYFMKDLILMSMNENKLFPI